jgi:hypothetical protein
MRYVLYVVPMVVLAGCAGSPVHTSGLSVGALRQVDNYTLCKAYAPREAYYPSARVINEVARRGIDCSTIYQYRSMAPVINALDAAQRTQNPAYNNRIGSGSTCFSQGEFTSGFYKTCSYNCPGGLVTRTVSATTICPLTIQQ